MTTAGVIGIIAALVIGAAVGSILVLALRRRSAAGAVDPEDVVATARLEAQRTLARAEEEGRARAEAYREREEAGLEHRRVELSTTESRLAQREETLEQRATNLAQREQLLIRREDIASIPLEG